MHYLVVNLMMIDYYYYYLVLISTVISKSQNYYVTDNDVDYQSKYFDHESISNYLRQINFSNLLIQCKITFVPQC